MLFDNDPLGLHSTDIKYEGSARATQYCIDDFMNHLYGIRKIKDMTILTLDKYHALMLAFQSENYIVFIKSGLTSGYSGEGPKGTSLIIRLAEEADIPIKELNITASLLKRINSSQATQKDIEFIKNNSRETLDYDRLCLKNVDKDCVQKAKESFKKNKNVIFVKSEDEKTKDAIELNLEKLNKKVDILLKKLEKIEMNTNNSDISSMVKDFISVVASLKTLFGQ